MDAVVYAGEPTEAMFELNAGEVIFPLTVERGGIEYIAPIHMTRYSVEELAEMLSEVTPQFLSRGRKTTVEIGSTKALVNLFDNHFVWDEFYRVSQFAPRKIAGEWLRWCARRDSNPRPPV